MLASFPASMLNQKSSDLGILNRFRLDPSRSRQPICAYFDLIVAASSARFFCHASYSGVPGRGGTSFGIPPSHVGTLSATAPLTAGRGSVAHADSTKQAVAANRNLVTLNFMVVTTPLQSV
jgi:hypothetical protein